MEVDSVARDHQQTNQEEPDGDTGQEQQVPQCQEAVASSEDTEPVNQTEHTEEPGNLKSAPCSDDNIEVQAPVSQNGHHADHSVNQGDDYEEQIDVVNSDHDENDVKSTANNVVLEENEPVATVDDSGEKHDADAPVEGTNENQNQETTNENHEESQSPPTEDHHDQKESQSSEEEVTESILEKVEENSGDTDNNEKNSEEQEDGPEAMQTEDNESSVIEEQQEPSGADEELAEQDQSEDTKEVCPENEANCESAPVSVENGVREESKEEEEDVPQDLESEATEAREPVEAVEASEATESSEAMDVTEVTETNEAMESEGKACEEETVSESAEKEEEVEAEKEEEVDTEKQEEAQEQKVKQEQKEEQEKEVETETPEEKEEEGGEVTRPAEAGEPEAELAETEDEILSSDCANNDGAEVESSK